MSTVRKLFWFLLIYRQTLECVGRGGDNSNLVALALSQVVHDYYLANSVQFDCMTYGESLEKVNEIVGSVLRLSEGNCVLKAINTDEAKEKIKIDKAAIVLFDSFNSYLNFHRQISLRNKSQRRLHILIYVADSRNYTDESFYSVVSGPFSIFHFESFVRFDDDFSLSLVRYEIMKQPKCREWNRIVVNRFSARSRRWKLKDFFPPRYQNYNGCELIVTFNAAVQPISNLNYENGTITKVWGYAIDINEILGKHLNYTYIYNPRNPYNGHYYNPTIGFDFKLIIAPISENADTLDVDFTHPVILNREVIAVTRGELYTSFEKLFLPFKIEVWFCLILTFVIAVGTIALLKCGSRETQMFVFGSRVRTPFVNLV